MHELIEKLKSLHGLSTEQSHGIVNTVKEFIKEKFPMFGSQIDNLFPHQPAAGNTPSGDTGSTEGPASKGGSFLDNISEMIPGATGEKAEQFIKDKLSDLTGGNK